MNGPGPARNLCFEATNQAQRSPAKPSRAQSPDRTTAPQVKAFFESLEIGAIDAWTLFIGTVAERRPSSEHSSGKNRGQPEVLPVWSWPIGGGGG